MPYIFAEWICQKCKNAHRVRYNLKILPFVKDGWEIRDPALGKYTNKALSKYVIFFQHDTETKTIIEKLRKYINEFYTPEKETLKIEVCMNE